MVSGTFCQDGFSGVSFRKKLTWLAGKDRNSGLKELAHAERGEDGLRRGMFAGVRQLITQMSQDRAWPSQDSERKEKVSGQVPAWRKRIKVHAGALSNWRRAWQRWV